MTKIEPNIPLPVGRRNLLYPFASMNVGDSFLVKIKPFDPKRAASIRACASAFGKKNSAKFTCKRVDDGIRVWRLS